MKYKAKQAIDTFFVRLGDVSSALSVWLGASLFAFDVGHFAVFNALLCLAWLGLAVLVGQQHERLRAAELGVAT
jgi:ATP:ADP antiporter, AAA family